MRKRNLPEALASLGHLGTLASPDSPGERKQTELSEHSHARSNHSTLLPASSGRRRASLPHCRLGLSSHLLRPKTWVPGLGAALTYCSGPGESSSILALQCPSGRLRSEPKRRAARPVYYNLDMDPGSGQARRKGRGNGSTSEPGGLARKARCGHMVNPEQRSPSQQATAGLRRSRPPRLIRCSLSAQLVPPPFSPPFGQLVLNFQWSVGPEPSCQGSQEPCASGNSVCRRLSTRPQTKEKSIVSGRQTCAQDIKRPLSEKMGRGASEQGGAEARGGF